MRSAYLDELAAAEGYRRAAEAPENADLAAIYLRHASDEELSLIHIFITGILEKGRRIQKPWNG